MTVSPLEKWPGWTRILVTAIISAVCSAGIIAGILVLALTKGPEVRCVMTSSFLFLDFHLAVNSLLLWVGGP